MNCSFKARTPPPTTIQYRLTDWCQLHWDEFKWENSFQHNILKFPYRCLFNKLNLFHFRKDNSLKKFKIQGFRANTVPISQKLKISLNRISLFLWGPGRVYITQKGSKSRDTIPLTCISTVQFTPGGGRGRFSTNKDWLSPPSSCLLINWAKEVPPKSNTIHQPEHFRIAHAYWSVKISVDPERFDADPDPTFYVDADPDLDPNFT